MSGADQAAPGSQNEALGSLTRKEKDESSYERRRSRRQLLRRAGALAFTLLAIKGENLYATDVAEVQAMLANTHPYITETSPLPPQTEEPLAVPRGVYETMDTDEQAYVDTFRHLGGMATVNFSGWGRRSMPDSARVYSPFDKIGANWTMHYDPNGISTKVLAQTIINEADGYGGLITQINFIGNSAGSPIAIDTATQMVQMDSKLTVRSISIDSPAVANQALREKSRKDGAMLVSSVDLPGPDLGFKDSRYVRVAAEMYTNWNRVHGLGSFFDVLGQETKTVFSDNHPAGTDLLVDQYRMIDGPMVRKDFKILGNVDPTDRPKLFFIAAKYPRQDDVVNVVEAYKDTKEWADEAGLELVDPIGIVNLKHGEPEDSLAQYHDAFDTIVIPTILGAKVQQLASAKPKSPLN